MKQALVAIDHTLQREYAGGPLAARLSHPTSELGIRGQAQDRLGERRGIPGWNENPGLPVDRHLRHRIHVGRGLDNDIVVGAPEISRRHAVIARDREGISIRDLGSANGTYVNGQAVTEEPAKLRPGDQVMLGDVPFTIRWR